jgi:hypothetical protein
MNGIIYCNTPEFYRTLSSPGISDYNENAFHTIRTQRGDHIESITINDIEINPLSLTHLTISRPNSPHGWMHCWTIFRFPSSESELKQLDKDLRRIRSEFGYNYVFLPATHFNEFVQRISRETNDLIFFGAVHYKEHFPIDTAIIKATTFAYQREFRFVFSKCVAHELVPRCFTIQNGFRDLLLENPVLKIASSQTASPIWTIFEGQ